MTKIFLGP